MNNTNALILLQSAKDLNIKTQVLKEKPFKIKFIYQNKSHIIQAKSFNLNTSTTAIKTAKHKHLTLQTLALANLPVPRHATISSPHHYQDISIPFPQVIKPSTGEKGKHVYLNIKNKKQGQKAINAIFQASELQKINIETYHQGNDYRFLCLNFQLIGVAQRHPPTITGNNQHTIKQLIDQENLRRYQQNQKAGRRMLNRLKLQGRTLQTILPQGKTIQLYPIPNFSTGGSVTTINPKTIHPSIIKLAETTARTIKLQICGIDMLIKSEGLELSDVLVPNLNKNIKIIELNSDPGLRLHDWPNHGQPQHTAHTILKSIFSI